jgi:hypothetical protein
MTLRSRLAAAEKRLDAAPPRKPPPEFMALLEARYGPGAVPEDPPAVEGESEGDRLARTHEVLRRDRGL